MKKNAFCCFCVFVVVVVVVVVLGGSYSTSNKFLLVARHTLTKGLQKCL